MGWGRMMLNEKNQDAVPTSKTVSPRDLMKKLANLIIITSLLSVFFIGCSKHQVSQTPAAGNTPILKIAVYADGRLTVAGQPSTVNGLQKSLRRLSQDQGTVWYYREGGTPPPPVAIEVMKTLIDAQVPIRYSSRPDYSDSTDADGRPIED